MLYFIMNHTVTPLDDLSLEERVDARGLKSALLELGPLSQEQWIAVMSELEDMCYEKIEHLRSAYQADDFSPEIVAWDAVAKRAAAAVKSAEKGRFRLDIFITLKTVIACPLY